LPKKEHLYTWKISSVTPGNQWVMEHYETKDGSRESIKEILELSRISNAPFSV